MCTFLRSQSNFSLAKQVLFLLHIAQREEAFEVLSFSRAERGARSHIMQENSWLAEPVSPELHLLCAEAKKSNCLEEMERTFSKQFVDVLLKGAQEKSTADVLQCLRDSIEARKVVHSWERKMDTHGFAERACGGFWASKGKDLAGRHILWIRSGLLNASFGGKSSLRKGTQEWYSALRAEIYMFEVHYRASIADGTFVGATSMVDMRGQGFLAGNNRLYLLEVMGLINTLFPDLGLAKKTYAFGLSAAATSLLSIATKYFSKQSPLQFSSIEAVINMVQDEDGIPRWVNDYAPTAVPHDNATILWGFEKIMGTGGQSIMQNDIFNPDVQEYSNIGKRSSQHVIYQNPVSVKETPFSKLSVSTASPRARLEISAFEDDDEDNEF